MRTMSTSPGPASTPSPPIPTRIPGSASTRTGPSWSSGLPSRMGPGNSESLAFSGVKTVNVGGNFGPQDDSHPQLVINQNDGGQITVAWDDFGSGATASPPFDDLMSNLVQPGDTYGFRRLDRGDRTGHVRQQRDHAGVDARSPIRSPSPSRPSAIDNLTVTVDLIDQESVQNLSLTLVAPGGQQSPWLPTRTTPPAQANQNQGLQAAMPSGCTVSPRANGHPGIDVGTIFDDNATRNIFDPTDHRDQWKYRDGLHRLLPARSRQPDGFRDVARRRHQRPVDTGRHQLSSTLATDVPDQGEVRGSASSSARG